MLNLYFHNNVAEPMNGKEVGKGYYNILMAIEYCSIFVQRFANRLRARMLSVR